MLKSIFGGRALFRRVGEQARYKVFAVLRDCLPNTVVKVVLALANFLHDVLVRLPIERRHAREENVRNDTTGPDIALMVVVFVEDLGRDVVWRAKLLVEVTVRVIDQGCTEIDDLDLVELLVLLKKDVLRLEITVHNVPLMAVVDAGEDLFHEDGTVTLAEFTALEDLIEELATLADLGHEVVPLLIFEELIHFNDVRVVLHTH